MSVSVSIEYNTAIIWSLWWTDWSDKLLLLLATGTLSLTQLIGNITGGTKIKLTFLKFQSLGTGLSKCFVFEIVWCVIFSAVWWEQWTVPGWPDVGFSALNINSFLSQNQHKGYWGHHKNISTTWYLISTTLLMVLTFCLGWVCGEKPLMIKPLRFQSQSR